MTIIVFIYTINALGTQTQTMLPSAHKQSRRVTSVMWDSWGWDESLTMDSVSTGPQSARVTGGGRR